MREAEKSLFDLREEYAMVERINEIRNTIRMHLFCDEHPDRNAFALRGKRVMCEECWEACCDLR